MRWESLILSLCGMLREPWSLGDVSSGAAWPHSAAPVKCSP